MLMYDSVTIVIELYRMRVSYEAIDDSQGHDSTDEVIVLEDGLWEVC